MNADRDCLHLYWTTVTGEMYICESCGRGRKEPPVVIDAEFEVIDVEFEVIEENVNGY